MEKLIYSVNILLKKNKDNCEIIFNNKKEELKDKISCISRKR